MRDLASLLPSPLTSSVAPILSWPEGPSPALLMLVGEHPTYEVNKFDKTKSGLRPFGGTAGWLLQESMKEIGLPVSLAFRTTVGRSVPLGNDPENWVATTLKARTPEHQLIDGIWAQPAVAAGRQLLRQEVSSTKPTLVIALGNLALWALTGLWGIRKWRSSILQCEIDGHVFKVVPTFHPTAVLREFKIRGTFLHDLRRAKKELERGPLVAKPDYKFTVRPNFGVAKQTLQWLIARLNASTSLLPISSDIETRAGHTACVCLCWSSTEAICIPWMCVERAAGYWTVDEEAELIWLLRIIYQHPMIELIWQNGAYDHQYEARWHFVVPKLGWDTMIAHHAMFSVSPKALDYLSSMYCDYHRFWKDDGRNWDPSSMPEEEYWIYNCEDGVRTFEIRQREQEVIEHMTANGWPKLPEVVAFQHAIQPAVVRMMLRGFRSSDLIKGKMAMAVMTRSAEIQTEVNEILGQEINIDSPKQMTTLFYETLGQTPIYSRLPNGARGGLTCDDDALEKLAGGQPILRQLIRRIQALRSAGKSVSTIQMKRDVDGRLRCSYNVAGTKTYRFSSSKNAFDSGGNLQNITVGDDDIDILIPLPNIREMFLFDEGMMGFDLDGDSADLRIVTGESGCKAMQAYFAAKVKPYVEIAKEFYRDQTITKHHPSYKRMKALCHGTNYGGEANGLSERIGLPVHDIERMQTWYFGMCPEIKQWQDDIKNQGENRGYIENPFGYRLYNWDRWSRKVANEFLAWTPQSTVGILINKILLGIDQQLPEVQLLLQVHDSLTGQYPRHLGDAQKRQILAIADAVVIPCRSGSITVPSGMKQSAVSWGACE